MPSSNFPLRWESTGDKWWYASPIDWAAANGHYDLVRELLRLDGNHLIKLTSLRRVQRLESVWDNEEQFHDAAKHRSNIAHQLFNECQTQKHGKHNNSLIVNGYGGWLLYTAASAGDLGFVLQLLGKHPLLVFGEGEYGLTDILYGAARSKHCEVFRVIFDFAVKPRFLSGNGRKMDEGVDEVPMAFKEEVKNRAVHAAARGGNLEGLKELLGDCSDVLGYRDVNGSTILHAAAGKGQVEVVKHLIASYEMISSIDNDGNTPLHVAAYKGQLSVVEALIQASPLSGSVVNKAGNTYLHMFISGFQTPAFRRLDRQIELMKQLVCTKCFNIEDIINFKNSEGRTAFHLAIIGNVHSNLVELLMSARYINVNIRDDHGMTPLDYLKRQPRSASSDMLIRQLISAGGISSCKDDAVRKAFASHLKMQGICSSPGTSFRVPDNEIFLSTGIDHLLDFSLKRVRVGHLRSSSRASQCDSINEDNGAPDPDIKKSGPLHKAAKRLKTMLHWPLIKKKETERSKMGEDGFSDKRRSTSEETPIPLREKFSNPALSSNKRTLEVRSNISSPTNRKKFASGAEQGVMQDQPFFTIPAQSPSSSFSKSSISSHGSLEKGKGIYIEDEMTRPSCSKQIDDHDTPNVSHKQSSMNKKSVNPILCFGGSHLSVKNPIGKHSIKRTVSVA